MSHDDAGSMLRVGTVNKKQILRLRCSQIKHSEKSDLTVVYAIHRAFKVFSYPMKISKFRLKDNTELWSKAASHNCFVFSLKYQKTFFFLNHYTHKPKCLVLSDQQCKNAHFTVM